MKKVYVILLVLTFALRPVLQIGTVIYYQLHVDEIVEKYCVNKSKPKLQCHGKCYLSKQLKAQETPDQDNKGVFADLESFVPLYFEEVSAFAAIQCDPIAQAETVHVVACYAKEISYDIDPPPRLFLNDTALT